MYRDMSVHTQKRNHLPVVGPVVGRLSDAGWSLPFFFMLFPMTSWPYSLSTTYLHTRHTHDPSTLLVSFRLAHTCTSPVKSFPTTSIHATSVITA